MRGVTFVATSISQVDPFDNPDTANDDAAPTPTARCSRPRRPVPPRPRPAPERRRIAHADCTPASASGVHNTVNPADRSAVVAVGAVIVGAPGPCDPDTNADNNQPNRPAVVATACAVAADAMSCDLAHHALGIASTYPVVASRTANARPAREPSSRCPTPQSAPQPRTDQPVQPAPTDTRRRSLHHRHVRPTKPRPPRRCSITTRAPHTGPAGCHTGADLFHPDTCRAKQPDHAIPPWRRTPPNPSCGESTAPQRCPPCRRRQWLAERVVAQVVDEPTPHGRDQPVTRRSRQHRRRRQRLDAPIRRPNVGVATNAGTGTTSLPLNCATRATDDISSRTTLRT